MVVKPVQFLLARVSVVRSWKVGDLTERDSVDMVPFIDDYIRCFPQRSPRHHIHIYLDIFTKHDTYSVTNTLAPLSLISFYLALMTL